MNKQRRGPFVAQGRVSIRVTIAYLNVYRCWSVDTLMCNPRQEDSMYIQFWLTLPEGSIIFWSHSHI